MRMNGLNFVRVRFGMDELKLLVDSGATLSILFSSCISSKQILDNVNKVKIMGIAGSTYSLGSTNIELKVGQCNIKHEFQVINDFDSNFQGVLGSDFFCKHAAILNYETFIFSFVYDDKRINLPLESEHNKYTYVPPRCEFIAYFNNSNYVDDCVILPEQICDGVFTAGMVVKPFQHKMPVRILNTTENEVRLRNFMPKCQSASDFYIYKFSDVHMSVNRIDELLNVINTQDLTTEEISSLQKICAKFADVFQLDNDPVTVSNLNSQEIRLQENVTPSYVKPYRLPYFQKTEIHNQVSKMLSDGIIEPSNSEWSAPLLIVPKRVDNSSGIKKYRVVVDYRELNKRIQNDRFPLPNIETILDSLQGAMYFSHLDLYQGFYQVNLEQKSRQYTSFMTDRGQFQMTRLPMGLKISPSAFSRAMTVAMSGLNYDKCFIYLDDLIVFGNNLTTHNQNLIKVLHRLRKLNLKLNPRKCDFLKKQLLFLGHIVSENGILPDPEKTRVVQDYPVPKDGKETKRFVAFANYYRRFIKNFAEITWPLNYLTKKGVIFKWTPECQLSFDKLKKALLSPPILAYPDLSESNQFILRTDASGYSLGAILANSDDKPVAYASRALNNAEKMYPVIEKELLAIVWAVKKFRPYLFNKTFKIYTDHRPLIYLFGMVNPSSRLIKFRLLLEEYDFSVHFIKGKDNVAADALSRITITSDELKKTIADKIFVTTRAESSRLKERSTEGRNIVRQDIRFDHPGIVELIKPPVECVELQVITELDFEKILNKSCNSQFDDNIIVNNIIYDKKANIIYIKQDSRSTFDLGHSLIDLKNICVEYEIPELLIISNEINKLLLNELRGTSKYLKNIGIKINVVKDIQRIDDKETQQIIINDFHLLSTGGHAGINRTYNNIKRYYFWPSMHKDITYFVKRCDQCQKGKYSLLRQQPMSITTTSTFAFQKVFLDIVGPLEADQFDNKYILSLQCDLSKYVEGYPLPNKEAKTVAKAFAENFILRYGIPEEVLTDKGTEFLSSIFKETCKLLNIKQLNSTAYHHETLGAIENSHKSLGDFLRIHATDHRETWSSWVQFWCFAYNNSVHTATRFTPFELVFGRSCQLPSNLVSKIDPVYNFENYPIELKYRLQVACNEAANNLKVSKLKRKMYYDDKYNCKQIQYNVGSKVLLRNTSTNKAENIFKGPYLVLEDKGVNLVISVGNKPMEVHKNRVKLYHE